MRENNGIIIHPGTYETWVGFAHDFCKGCVYENGSFRDEDKRIEECSGCKDTQDYYYYRRGDQPIKITQNKEGKNIAKLLTVK